MKNQTLPQERLVQRRPVIAGRRSGLSKGMVVLVVAVSIPLGFATHLRDLAPPIGVRVDGKLRYLPANTTLADVVSAFHLKARAGSLLDVEGDVLTANLYPGAILVNGHIEGGNPVLPNDSVITVQAGRDRREPVVREVSRMPGGTPANPQFTLAMAPGEQVVTVGKLSGKVASTVFRPTGRFTYPREVALTFDDGPGPYTGRVLAVLKRFKVKATFFVIGFMAAANPEMVRAEVRAGMAVGSHSWDHPNTIRFNRLGARHIYDEIARTSQLLHSIGVTTSLFRPPGGSYSRVVLNKAREFDSRVVLWNVDPRDWQGGQSPARIVQNVLANVRPGSIIEMHDGGGDRTATIAALPRIIRGIRSRGLKLVALQP
jgi:peptidoglycan/xylan/chitin deacetylase (PgdA/CDA1 family)